MPACIDLTERVARVRATVGGDGLLHVFVPHATAGVALMETGSGSERDLEELLERLFPRDDRYRIGTGASVTAATTCCRCSCRRRSWCRSSDGALALGTWQSVVLVDPNRDNDMRTVRLSFVPALRPRGRQRYWPGARSSLAAADETAWTSRSRSRTRSSPSSSTSSPDDGRNSTRSPSLADPDVGPDERDVAPREPLGRGHRRRGDQQAARGLAFAVLGRAHDEPVAGESNARRRDGLLGAWLPGLRAAALGDLVARFVGGGVARPSSRESSERDRVRCLAMEARRCCRARRQDAEGVDAIDHWQKGRERIEAEDLLIHVLGYEPEPTTTIPGKHGSAFESLVDRRATGEPIPYIKGYAEFRGIELLTKPGVFVPRDSSEFLAEQAVRRLRGRKQPVHVDLATGGGTIALAVADEVPKARGVGHRRGGRRREARSQERRAPGPRARFVKGDLFGALPSTVARAGRRDHAAPAVRAGRRDRRPPRRDPRLGAAAHPHRPERRRAGPDPSRRSRSRPPGCARAAGCSMEVESRPREGREEGVSRGWVP